MKDLIERLNEEVLISDGAMGTMLIEKGMPSGACPEHWGIKNERILSSIHSLYIEAGADMIITNTFGANSIKLGRFKLQKKAREINRRAVEIAKKAAADRVYVLGDIGPTGEYLKPAGNIETEEMQDSFAQQVEALKDGGVDAIILETMSDPEELKAAIMAVKENAKLPLIASMTFQKIEGKGFRTISGVSIPQFVDEALLAGCDIIGANCSVTIEDMIELISEIRALTTAFLIAQPNAGMPRLVGGNTVYEQSPDEFARHIPSLIKAGANIIGGCCGTTPEHIKRIKSSL